MNKKYMIVSINRSDERVYINYTDSYSQALFMMTEMADEKGFVEEVIVARTSDGVICATLTTREEELECSD